VGFFSSTSKLLFCLSMGFFLLGGVHCACVGCTTCTCMYFSLNGRIYAILESQLLVARAQTFLAYPKKTGTTFVWFATVRMPTTRECVSFPCKLIRGRFSTQSRPCPKRASVATARAAVFAFPCISNRGEDLALARSRPQTAA